MRSPKLVAVAALTGCLMAVGAVAATPASARGPQPKPVKPDFTLTVLHNNDGESSLLPTTVDGVRYGGIARFQRKVDTLRITSNFSWGPGESLRRGTVLLNSGDNFLAGTTFQASRQPGAPFYDARAVKLLRYDALAIGNHEFDFGPEVFAEFVDGVGRGVPFVSANLDFSDEPTLAPRVGRQLFASTVLRVRGERVGVVGLTTPTLPTISSPGRVRVSPEVAAIAQAEVDALTRQGVNKIILVSHLQNLQVELDLVSQLRRVDAVIGGGGDEVLADPGDRLFPRDTTRVFGSYPLVRTDADGKRVPVVTTPGNYLYVGQLELTFDRDGNVLFWDDRDSGLQLVVDSGPGAVGEDPIQKRFVERPVAQFVEGLATQIVGSSQVVLDCERPEIRGREANCGNLIADAHLATARARAAQFGVDAPQVAIQNGGGIRGEIDQPAGPISVADTFRLAPFGNFVAIAEDVPAETLRQTIEEGARLLPATGEGGFVHLAGARVVIDTSFPARVTNPSTGEQLSPGSRVRSLVLDDGTVLVENGVARDVTVDVAGLNFSLNGGDRYPRVPFTTVGVTDQQSLQNYIESLPGRTVTEAQYPRAGTGRITITTGTTP